MNAKTSIYLDAHATTPVDPEVLSAMLPYFTEYYANGNHRAGWKTDEAIENSRFQVANLIGARPSEVTFTAGATEAINMALIGLAKANNSGRNHIITQRTEHKAVLQCIGALEKQGYNVTMLEVDQVGRIDLQELKNTVTNKTLVVAIMLANNEIGTVQPIEAIGDVCKNKSAKFFCDLTQGIGWYPLDLKKMNIDMAALAAHKFYGPRGVGALYVKKKNPQITIEPILFGGGQENGFRPGTSNVPGIVGLGKACELLQINGKEIYVKIREMRDRLQKQLFSSIEGVKLNGCPDNRHPGNLNMAIPSISGEQLKELLPNVMFSTSSACSSTSPKPSHVISALGVNNAVIESSFRLGIHKYNNNEEIDFVSEKIIQLVSKVQIEKNNPIPATKGRAFS
ncbi:MAG: cysteine desulfurase family protein [Flavobacteriaceae bacterium]